MRLLKYITDSLFLRIIIIVVLSAAIVTFSFYRNWLWVSLCALLLIFAIWWLYDLYNKQTRKVMYMLDALENNDNALRFIEGEGNADNRKVNELLNRVTRILHEVKAETAQQEKYYELILSFINTGIIVLNDSGAVYQKNNEAMRLLGLEVFTHVSQLNRIEAGLANKFSDAKSEEKFQILINNERGTANLSVRVSEITIRNEHLRILAINDINSELDEKEIDAWIRLIRVLTHEIMNSVTPITSLSDTLLTLADTKDEEIRRGLQTISATGKGLLSFVESYRKFTRVPTPEPTLFYVKGFIERMVDLAKYQLPCDNIRFKVTVEPADLILYADENLISQVIINLLKNAIQAINDKPDGLILINSYSNESEEILIEVSNNGPEIPPDVAEQIFVPFFTTKNDGSGIGLSLSRQIMRLSGGSISLKSTHPNHLTTFSLLFK